MCESKACTLLRPFGRVHCSAALYDPSSAEGTC